MTFERTSSRTVLGLSSNLEETLRGRRCLVTLFLARKMACPGCPMARFETLSDAARHYGVDGDELVAAVRQAVALHEAEAGRRPLECGPATRTGGAGGGVAEETGPGPAPSARPRAEEP